MGIFRRHGGYGHIEYNTLCAGWFDQVQLPEMARDEANLVVHEGQGLARDTAITTFVFRWLAFGRTCTGLIRDYKLLDIPVMHHLGEVKYGREVQTCCR